MLTFIDLLDLSGVMDYDNTVPRVHTYLRHEASDLRLTEMYGKNKEGQTKCAVKVYQSGRITVLEPDYIELPLKSNLIAEFIPNRFFCCDEHTNLVDAYQYLNKDKKCLVFPAANQGLIKDRLEGFLVEANSLSSESRPAQRSVPRQLSVTEGISVHFGAFYTIHAPVLDPTKTMLAKMHNNLIIDSWYLV